MFRKFFLFFFFLFPRRLSCRKGGKKKKEEKKPVTVSWKKNVNSRCFRFQKRVQR